MSEDDGDSFVTREECAALHNNIKGSINSIREDLGTVKKAIFGEDGRGGITKDIMETMTKNRLTERAVVIPTSLVSSIVTRAPIRPKEDLLMIGNGPALRLTADKYDPIRSISIKVRSLRAAKKFLKMSDLLGEVEKGWVSLDRGKVNSLYVRFVK